MDVDRLSRAELLSALEAHLRRAREKDEELGLQRARLLGDLRTHEAELEVQNRELRVAQRALEQSCARFEELYDLAPVSYFTFDSAGFVLDLNVAAAGMLGIDRADAVGRPFLSLVEMKPPDAFWEHLRRAAEAPQPAVSELRFATRGGVLDVQAASCQVLDARGRTVGFRSSFTDITEHKRVEAELQRSRAQERRLRRRFEALDHASFILTQTLGKKAERGLSFVLQTIADEARAMVGATFGALGVGDDPGKPFTPWAFSADEPQRFEGLGSLPEAQAVLAEAIRAGKALRLTDLRAHPGFTGLPPGRPPITGFLGTGVWVGERPVGALFLGDKHDGTDFTDEDERIISLFAERAGLALEVARLNDEVHAAVEARENLLAVVSHDLRNPLQAILVSTSLLTKGSPPEERRASKKQLGVILRSSVRMTRLLDDLLQAENINSGTFVVEPRAEQAALLMDEALQELEPLASEKKVNLVLEPLPELPPLRCDRPRVLQVLHNVVGNAIKFLPTGGTVRLRLWVEGSLAQLAVADNGPGIPPEHLPHVFERFWRSRPNRSPGVGLGLFIARGIVEAHGGTLSVQSTVGEGTTFTFSLPLAA